MLLSGSVEKVMSIPTISSLSMVRVSASRVPLTNATFAFHFRLVLCVVSCVVDVFCGFNISSSSRRWSVGDRALLQ